MTVADLIAALSTLDPSLRVVTDGYEGGLEDTALSVITIALNVRDSDYFGPHEEDGVRTSGDARRVPAVYLSRRRES